MPMTQIFRIHPDQKPCFISEIRVIGVICVLFLVAAYNNTGS